MIIMLSLPIETQIRLFVWPAIGLIIDFAYSRRRAQAVIAGRIARAERETIERTEGLPTQPRAGPGSPVIAGQT